MVRSFFFYSALLACKKYFGGQPRRTTCAFTNDPLVLPHGRKAQNYEHPRACTVATCIPSSFPLPNSHRFLSCKSRGEGPGGVGGCDPGIGGGLSRGRADEAEEEYEAAEGAGREVYVAEAAGDAEGGGEDALLTVLEDALLPERARPDAALSLAAEGGASGATEAPGVGGGAVGRELLR